MNIQKPTRRAFLGATMATLALPILGAAQPTTQPNNSSATDKTEPETTAANSAKNPSNLTIAVLLYDKMTMLDAVGPYEVLHRLPNATVKFVGETTGLKLADSKMLFLNADYALDQVPRPDILLIPGGDPTEVMKSEKILNWIREAHKTTKLTTSVCTGSLVLGAAGLLKNLKATTHWATAEYLKNFGAEYVAARYVEQGKIITAAGVSAGIDMALFVAEKLHGKAVAEMLQLAVEYDPQPPVNAGSLRTADKKTVDAARRYFAERKNQ